MAATAWASISLCSARNGGMSGKNLFRDTASDKLDHHSLRLYVKFGTLDPA
jgi:hypothetical protein